MTNVIVALAALIVGTGIGYIARRIIALRQSAESESRAEKILAEARTKEREIILAAKDKALAVNEEAKREEEKRRKEIRELEERFLRREETFEKERESIAELKKTLTQKEEDLRRKGEEIETIKREQFAKLEKVAGLSMEEAKEVLLRNVEKRMEEDIMARIRKLEKEGTEEIEKRAREAIAFATQRIAGSYVSENTTSVVSLPSDEMKGRIIGKEGRNVKVFEKITGVDVIIDETPQAVVLSSHNPIRREAARITLERLIADGRIHPARIEEIYEKVKSEMAEDIKKAGQEAAMEASVGPLPERLIKILGRLKYRYSYGQNVLRHSVEMAHIAGGLAAELGANIDVAKKGALLHDIGKALDHEVEGTHVEIGMDILSKCEVPEEVIKAMRSHHEEFPYANIESIIVQTADALSGGRPGARRDTLENYLTRLTNLEGIAGSFEGVEKAYAIQAGRELRVFVTPEKISDLEALKLAQEIAKRVEDELKYPGEIKVTVIRETRAIEYAR
ncbi:MAG: ribonuclease Y [Parcubacteria group bacterium]|nr:ribonuclease Y [Parcubacteria group bacterium]